MSADAVGACPRSPQNKEPVLLQAVRNPNSNSTAIWIQKNLSEKTPTLRIAAYRTLSLLSLSQFVTV